MGGGLLAGAVGLLSHEGNRAALGRGFINLARSFGERLEGARFGDVGQAFRRSLSTNLAGQEIRGSALGNAIESTKRTAQGDILRILRRNAAVAGAPGANLGLTSRDAELLFGEHGVDIDIFTSSIDKVLAHSHYQKNINPHLSQGARKLFDRTAVANMDELLGNQQKFNSFVKGIKAGVSGEATPQAYQSIHKASMTQILSLHQKEGRVDEVLGRFGLKRHTLGDIVGSGFRDRVQGKLAEATLSQQGFGQYMKSLGQISEAETTFAQAAWSHAVGLGRENAVSAVAGLRTGILGGPEGGVLNTAPFGDLVKSVNAWFDQHTQIPLSPGSGGISPFKLFPWTRGKTRDFSRTLRKGAHLPSLMDALQAQNGPAGLFDDNGFLQDDIHFAGSRLILGSNGAELPGEWSMLDDYRGYGREVSRVMRAGRGEDLPYGRARAWAGDSWMGRIMDTLGLDRQGTDSSLSRLYSGLAAPHNTDDPIFRTQPLNLYHRLMGQQGAFGDEQINDVRSLFGYLSSHSAIANVGDVHQIFTQDIVESGGFNPAISRLFKEKLTGENMAEALRELDTVMGAGSTADPFLDHRFFQTHKEVEGLSSNSLRMLASRFRQSEANVLSTPRNIGGQAGLFDFEGLFGSEGVLGGEENLREHFVSEALAQVMRGGRPISETRAEFSQLMSNATTMATRENLSVAQLESLRVGLFSRGGYETLKTSAAWQPELAQGLFNELRTPLGVATPIARDIESHLQGLNSYGSPWLGPLEERGVGVYVVPKEEGEISAVLNIGKSMLGMKEGDWFDNIGKSLYGFFLGNSGEYGNVQTPGALWHSGYRLNNLLSSAGLGLPDSDLQTTADTYKNLLLKRVLPAFGAVEGWKYLNYKSQELLGTSPAHGIASVRMEAALYGSKASDIMGLTDFSKKIVELTPGLENYWQPRTEEEQKEYLTSGYEPVRAGRYWFMGSRSHILGEKIKYWSPSWYQMQMSDWQGAENVDLNNHWYWTNKSLIPNLDNPLAPLNLFRGYAWEEKHSVGDHPDRPYLVSGPQADPHTIMGQAWNTTIGGLLKPQVVLHPEALKARSGGGGAGIYAAAMMDPMLPGMMMGGKSQSGVGGLFGTGTNYSVGGGIGGGGGGTPVEPYDQRHVKLHGNIQVQTAEPEMDVVAANDWRVASRQIHSIHSDIQGIYGFGEETIMDSLGFGDTAPLSVMESPEKAYGWERRFWSRELGGAGGAISEWWRRVLPHRDRNRLEFNPVRNNQSQWMPGADDLVDYQHGDPYCISPTTLVEIGRLQFAEAGSVVAGCQITNHLGQVVPSDYVISRDIRSQEKVYKLGVSSLSATPIEVSEEHPLLTVDNPSQRRLYSSSCRIKYYQYANATMEGLERGLTRIMDLAEYAGVHANYMSGALLNQMVKDGKVTRSRGKVNLVVGAHRYDLHLLQRGLSWKEAQYLKVGDYVAYPLPCITETKTYLDLAQHISLPATKDYLYFRFNQEEALLYEEQGFVLKADHHKRAPDKKHKVLRRIPRDLKLTPEIGYLFGIYLAEGTPSESSVNFSLNVSEGDVIERILEGGKQVDPKCSVVTIQRSTGGISTNLYGMAVSQLLLSLFGKYSHHKQLPDEVMEWPKQVVASLLRGYIDGDGCHFLSSNKEYVSIKSVNLKLLLQIRKLCLALGVVGSIVADAGMRTSYIGTQEIRSGLAYSLIFRGNAARAISDVVGYDHLDTREHRTVAHTRIIDDYVILRVNSIEEIGDCPTVIGFQVDQGNSFCVAGVATHNTKGVANEFRVPGEAYERIHHPKVHQTRASALGGTVEEIAHSMFRVPTPGEVDETSYGFGKYVTEMGDKMHAAVQRKLSEQGIMLSAEERIYDPELQASGHYDALLNLNGEKVVGEVKSMGAAKFDKADSPFQEHVTQLNFYLHNLNLRSGLLIYIDRDNPDRVKTFDVGYSSSLYASTKEKVLEARKLADQMVNQGVHARADMYDAVTRAEILLDLESWSRKAAWAVAEAQKQIEDENDPEYKEYLQDKLTAAKKRSSAQHKLYQIHNYKFSQPTTTKYYTVQDVINPNTIRVQEGDQIIRLAGVSSSMERIQGYMAEHEELVNQGMSQMEAFFASVGVRAGEKIKVVTSAEGNVEDAQVIRGAVFAGNRNLAQELIGLGVGKEREDDDSAAGIAARYSSGDKIVGRMMEGATHLDTPFGTKFLGVGSALELYKRRQVYGTSAGDWAHPFKTYLFPTVEAIQSRGPVAAALTGAFVASLFAKEHGDKIIAAAAGGFAGAVIASKRIVDELGGGTWIPARVKKRREVEEYYDALRFMKAKALENYFARRAHTNIDRIMDQHDKVHSNVLSHIEELEAKKNELLYSGAPPATTRPRIKALNAQIAALRTNNNKVRTLEGDAAIALYYHKEAQKTMAGSSPGDTLQIALAGIPRYERELIQSVISEGTRKEKNELYRLLSDRQKSVLGVYLGRSRKSLPVKETLEEYFKHHQLPDASWRGWCVLPDESILLDTLETKRAGDLQVGDVLHSEVLGNTVEAVLPRMATEETLYTLGLNGRSGISATAGHPILVGKLPPCRRPSSRYGGHTTHGQVCMPSPSETCKICKTIPARDKTIDSTAKIQREWVKIEDVTCQDFLAFPLLDLSNNTSTTLEGLEVSEDLAFVFGLFLAEGHISHDRSQKEGNWTRGIGFTYCWDEQELLDITVREIERAFGANVRRPKPRKNCLFGECKTKRVGLFFEKHFGSGSGGKRLSPEVMKLEPRLLKQIILGHSVGDGDKRPLGWRTATVSESLAAQLTTLLWSLGAPATVRSDLTDTGRLRHYFSYRTADLEFGKNSRSKNSNVYLQDGWVYLRVKTITEREYTGLVYDFTMSKVHHYSGPYGTFHNCPEFDLNHARTITAREEGVTPIEMQIYPQNEVEAEVATEDVPVPVMKMGTPALKDHLSRVLSASGLKNVRIDMTMEPTQQESASSFRMEIKHDRTNEILSALG